VKILKAGKREVDPYKPSMLRRVHLWRKLLPIRRWLLIAGVFCRGIGGFSSSSAVEGKI